MNTNIQKDPACCEPGSIAVETTVAWVLLKTKRVPSCGTLYLYHYAKEDFFVCVENSNRSQMSQAFAKMIGGYSC